MKKERNNVIAHIWAIAVCLCLVLLAGFVFISYIYGGNNTDIRLINYIGETQNSDIAEVTFNGVDTENHICYFTLIKKDNTPFYFRFVGEIYDEWIDEQGNRCHESQMYDVITPYLFYWPEHGYKVLDADLIITVNGEIADTIPRKPGEYEISIDFSDMYQHLDIVSECVYVSHFEASFLFKRRSDNYG